MDLTTRVNLRRLAFSHFTQMVDRWDPMVQLHDDEIVGRFHSNTQLKLLHDASKAPIFSGKVTTAARGFDFESRSRRPAEVFQGGIETRTGRIDMPKALQPAEWAPRDENARVHAFAGADNPCRCNAVPGKSGSSCAPGRSAPARTARRSADHGPCGV